MLEDEELPRAERGSIHKRTDVLLANHFQNNIRSGVLSTMRVFIQNAHIIWQSSFRKKSLASPRSSRKSESRSRRSIHSVISPTGDSCWISSFLDYPFLLQSDSQADEFEVSETQSKILATLVPDIIICCPNLWQKEVESFVGVVLFADISGFTLFCEEHGSLRRGRDSAYTMSKMTTVLNMYLGAMVQLTISCGGDVIKFSGDAILALWKVCSDRFLYQVIHQAINCALLIQRKLSRQTDPQVDLQAKLTISAGNMSFGVVGTEKSRHYVLVGSPIHELRKADGMCESGEVILTPSAWNHCSAHNYHYTLSEENHVKVRQILYNPVNRELERLNSQNLISDVAAGGTRSVQDFNEVSQTKDKPFRQSIADGLRMDLAASLRAFMIPPVVQQIEAEQPLEYLTEMRQVTTMFINLLPSEALDDRRLVQLVDDVYCTVSRLVSRALGCLTKVSLFDKGVMLLAVFGLRGFKHEQESRRSLRCGLNVKRAIAEIPGVQLVSVGITTGMAYCGVVGHPVRREYTVIGAHVNKAARIMCAYPDCVTCERNTRQQSNLPAHFFVLRESKQMKGIEMVGPVYEYTEGLGFCSSRLTTQEVVYRPLLGRENLIGEIECLFHATAIREPHRHVQAVVLQGDAGVGKTRALIELTLRAEYFGLRTYSIAFQPRHGGTPFSALQHVCQQMLDSHSMSIDQFLLLVTRRNSTSSLSTDDVALLNESLNQKYFERGKIAKVFSPDQKRDRLPSLIFSLLRLVAAPMVIAVDDLHLMDDFTWQLCSDILELQTVQSLQRAPVLVVATFSPRDSYLSQSLRSILLHPAVMLRTLTGLPSDLLAPLACQLLASDGIQRQVVEILDFHSRGNPGWCANYLDSMIQSEGLQVQPIVLSAMLRLDFAVPDPELLHTDAGMSGASSCAVRRVRVAESGSMRSNVCDIHSRQSAEDVTDPLAEVKNCIVMVHPMDCEEKASLYVNDVIVSTFDCLPPYEQLVLKCASVIANTISGFFKRDMLLFLLQSVHKGSEEKTAASIKRLFMMGALECTSDDRDEKNQCVCSIKSGGPSSSSALHCETLCFQMATFQKAIYELLPGNQRKSFHSLAIDYLERSRELPLLCRACTSFEKFQTCETPRPRPLPLRRSTSLHDTPCTSADSKSSHSLPSRLQSGVSLDSAGQTERHPRNIFRTWASRIFKSRQIDIKTLTTSFSVRDCDCPTLVTDTVSQLIDHCRAAGQDGKQLDYMAEYGFLSMLCGYPLEALGILSETQTLLRGMLLSDYDSDNHRDKQSGGDKQTYVILLGRVLTLTGQACLSMGEVEQAQLHLSQALSALDITWPQSNALPRWLRLPKLFRGAFRVDLRLQQAACLSLLSDFYSASGAYSMSRQAASASLRLALACGRPGLPLCSALSCVLESSVLCGDARPSPRLERLALQCAQQYRGTALTGRFIARLLCAVFVRRFFEGKLIAAKDAGVVVLKNSEQLCSWRASLFILPLLIQTYVLIGEVGKAFSKLQKLKSAAERGTEDEYMSKVSGANYHILRLDILLDVGKPSGYRARQRVVEEAAKFVLLLLTAEQDARQDDTLEQSITVRLWLWFARQNDPGNGSYWQSLIEDASHRLTDWSALRYLEVLLLEQASQRGSPQILRSLMTRLHNVAKTTPVLLPSRFLHLRSYYTMLRRGVAHLPLSLHYLSKAMHFARKQGNILEMEWCQHTKTVWMEEPSGHVNDKHYSFLVPNNRRIV